MLSVRHLHNLYAGSLEWSLWEDSWTISTFHVSLLLSCQYGSVHLFPLDFYCLPDFKQCSENLCRATLECVVRERFGSKALRVFRLLLMKKMLDQKQVTDMAMIPSKEAKELLYTLLAENFVSLQVSENCEPPTP